jgi:DNA mismatch repair protein MutL
VEVKELFFSTPARRKFLKTDATELAHCVEAVRRHALARPDVGFAIWHEGKLVEQWRATRADVTPCAPPGRRAGRGLRGPRARAAPPGAVTVTGRAGLPDAARSRADQQYCYVNGRFVRDKVLTHAAQRLRGRAARPAQPVYALYIEIDPARVDVNVHPTKIEVRFRDSREVHQAVRHAVENALAAPRRALAARRCDARSGTPGDFEQNRPAAPNWQAQTAIKFDERMGHKVSDLQALWGTPAAQPAPPGPPWSPPAQPRLLPPCPCQLRSKPLPTQPTPGPWAAPWRSCTASTSWPSAQGLVLVDMHAAHERIVYERLKAQLDRARIASQPLLIPATFAATPRRWPRPRPMPTRWACWAWRSALLARTLAVRAVPTQLAQGDAVELARSVLAELGQHDASTVVQRAATRSWPPWPATARCAPTAA